MTKPNCTLLALLVCFAAVAKAQEPPAVDNAEAKKRTALVRGWILPTEKAPFRLRLNTGAEAGTPEERALAQVSNAARVTDGSYIEASAGTAQVEVVGEDGKILASESASLRNRRYYTVVAAQDTKGKWSLDVFLDGPAESGAPDRPVRVLNFADGRETMLEVPGSQPTKVAAETIFETKYPAKLLGITVKVLATDGGAPAQSSTEVDLSVSPSAYVVVLPDYRGRMRPRIIDGGEPKFPEESAGGAAPGPANEQR